MRISMQSSDDPRHLHLGRWGHAIVGGELDDDRSERAMEFAREWADEVHCLQYGPRSFNYVFDGNAVTVDSLRSTVRDMVSEGVLLEATTLRFVEILTCLRTAKACGNITVSVLYLEPRDYSRPQYDHVLHRRDFELSREFEPFSGVPGCVIRLSGDRPVRAVFLLGYEGQRLSKALQENGLKPSRCSVVFGVPAFRPGWEMHSFANNVECIIEEGPMSTVLFAGADNPMAAYEAIQEAHVSCDASTGERLLVVPIGTKPHALGAALFACEHPEVGVIYDHPTRSGKRSKNVATWHLYEVDWAG